MATYTGQNGTIRLGANPIAEIRAFEIQSTSDTLDDTVMGDTWRTNKSTFRSWSGSMDVLHDITNTTGQNALVTGAALTASFFPSGNTSGNVQLTGSIRITERVIKSSHEGLVEMTVSFIGDGALAESAVV